MKLWTCIGDLGVGIGALFRSQAGRAWMGKVAIAVAVATMLVHDDARAGSDNDSVPDEVECIAFLDNSDFNPSLCRDTDNDGAPDFQDMDDDNDGVLTRDEVSIDPTDGEDADHDGIPTYRDIDSDGDGIVDSVECSEDPCENSDDDDGLPDMLDVDSDNDGVDDEVEAFDVDGDGTIDVVPLGVDLDGTGLDDAIEAMGKYVPLNSDDDTLPNWRDSDDDNDGMDTMDELTDIDSNGMLDYLDAAVEPVGFDAQERSYAGVSCSTSAQHVPNGLGFIVMVMCIALAAWRRQTRREQAASLSK